MKMIYRVFLYLIGSIILSQNTFAQELKLAYGLSTPPYVISKNDSGIELDIVKEAFALSNITVKPIYVPLARLTKQIELDEIDGSVTIMETLGIKNVYYSDTYITYENIAVSLKKNYLNIKSIADLRNKDIITFQNAKIYLGNEFKQAVSQNHNYYEFYDQKKQVKMLFKNRTQVIVLDRNIFDYYKKDSLEKFEEEVVIHKIFPDNKYKIAFKDSTIRDKFNLGLKEIISTGKYEQIIGKYLDPEP